MEVLSQIFNIVNNVFVTDAAHILKGTDRQSVMARQILCYVTIECHPEMIRRLASVLDMTVWHCKYNHKAAEKKLKSDRIFKKRYETVMRFLKGVSNVEKKESADSEKPHKSKLFVSESYSMGFHFSELDLIGIQRAKREAKEFFMTYGQGASPVTDGLFYQRQRQ